MAERFHDKIQFQIVTLRTAQELAAYNFKFQPSVQYLDLATNENLLRNIQPCSFKTIFTDEDIRKRITPERQVLYKFHLDLPLNLQDFSCKNRTEVLILEAFHLKQIKINSAVYNQGLARSIVTVLENDRRKIERLRNYVKIFEFLNFGECNDTADFLCDSIFKMLYTENCRDSILLRNVLALFSVPLWLSRREIPKVFEYVLLQAQRGRFSKDLWRCLDQRIDPVTFCFFSHKIQNVLLLVKYGTVTFIPYEISFHQNIDFIEKYVYAFIRSRRRNKRRIFFLFQLWYDFRYHRNSPEGLGCIWRCKDDPFLSRAEIASTFKPLLGRRAVKHLIEHYQIAINGNVCNSKPSPRTLKAICRVEVRRMMSFNHQLPFGVYSLEIPENLKLYLNLFT